MAYIVPQVLINQLISEVSLNTVKNQNVLVIGPNYQLFRYSDADEKAKSYIGRYDGKDVTDESGNNAASITDFRNSLLPIDLQSTSSITGVIPYPELPSASIPDAGYAKLYADDVVVKLIDVDNFTKLDDDTAGADLDGRIRFDFALKSEKRGYEVTIEKVYDESNEVIAEIAKITGTEPLYKDSEGKNKFKRDINPGDVFRMDYGDGKVFQSIITSVFASVPGSDVYDSIQFEDTLPDEVLEQIEANDGVYEGKVSFCAQFSGVSLPQKNVTRGDWNWTTYADTEEGVEPTYGIVVDSGMKVFYSNWGNTAEFDILDAKLYLEYRALLPGAATDIQTIASHTLVESTLGTLSPDNPLAFGAYMALLNSGDRLVYYVGIGTDDLSGYNVALGKASLTDEVYFIVPLTQDAEVIDAVKAHVEEMSTAENKLWRIGFVAQEAPTTDMIYDASANVDNKPFYAKFMASKRYPDVHNLMQFMWDEDEKDDRANTVVKCLTQVEPGDVVRIYTENSDDDWDDTPHYTERYVQKVVSNTVLQFTEGIEVNTPGSTSPDKLPEILGYDHHYKVEVYRKLGHARQAKYIADLSSSLATRRMYNVFPTVASNAGVSFGGEFLAAAAAGLASSVLPQQPITNVELNGIDDIPLVYQTFSRAELNTIAAGGTFIIMQDRPGSQVYVRHQISTAYSENNLLKAELSITKNLDSISYYFAELFAPLIGKYNITPELLDVIRARLSKGLLALETETGAGLYGPQVLAEGTEILELRQSDVNRDHVYAKVHLNLPVPFNYFDLDLEI